MCNERLPPSTWQVVVTLGESTFAVVFIDVLIYVIISRRRVGTINWIAVVELDQFFANRSYSFVETFG